MSADLLRRAAKEMRQRAEDAPHGPWVWEAVGKSGYPQRVTNPEALLVAECFENPDFRAGCAEHIASWHPAVALAVADWLDAQAELVETDARLFGKPATDATRDAAEVVARAYLGETE
jgi:hypothetical protein